MPVAAIYEDVKGFPTFDECEEDNWTDTDSYYSEVAESRQDYHFHHFRSKGKGSVLLFPPQKTLVSYSRNEDSANGSKDVYSIWEDSFVQLHQSLDTTELNPELEPVSSRAFITSLKVLENAFKVAPDLPAPEMVFSGDGGIDIEWSNGAKLVSIRIRKLEQQEDRIYFQDGDNFGSINFTITGLKSVLSQII